MADCSMACLMHETLIGVLATQLNSTQVYFKTVAERLK